MKKTIIFTISFIFLCISLFFALSIKAQDVSENLSSLTGGQDVISCGIASDNQRNKCCNKNNINSSNNSEKIIEKLPDILQRASNLISPAVSSISADIIPQVENTLINPCTEGKPSTSDYEDPNCICLPEDYNTSVLCDKYLKNTSEYNSCISCANNKNGIWTAIGCIDGDFNSFVSNFLLNIAIGLAGGFALLCIIYAAFQIQSSQGNAEKIKKAQEMLTSCIIGLILVIFSIFILRLIGVNILKIPGFR